MTRIERLRELHVKLHEGSGLPGHEYNEYQRTSLEALPDLIALYDAARLLASKFDHGHNYSMHFEAALREQKEALAHLEQPVEGAE